MDQNINISISSSQKTRLKRHLESKGATISAFVRRLIHEYMDAHNLNENP